MINSAYHLPFQFWYCDQVFSVGNAARITVRTDNPEGFTLLPPIIRAFSSLAGTGALSGQRIPPWESNFSLSNVASDADNELKYFVDRCYLADEALIVLAHMLLAANKASPIEFVKVVSTQPQDQRIMEYTSTGQSTYPALFSNLPFVVDNREPEGGGYTFFIELETPLEQRHELQLNNLFGVWINAVLLGGYSLFPHDPEVSYIEPDENEVTAYDNIVEWAVFKLHADPASLDGLINLLIAFHMRCQRIVQVEIT